jgi:transposase
MKRFIEGVSRTQSTMFPESLEDYIAEDNPVRVIDVFVDGLSLEKQGFSSAQPEATGRPAYHPATLLKLYTVISTASNPAVASNARPSATSS